MIRTNELIIAGIGIGVSVLAVYLIKNRKNKPEKVVQEGKQAQVVEKPNTPEPIIKSPYTVNAVPEKKEEEKPWLLSKGSRGAAVERLQIWLLRHHGWKGTVTKVFDQQTEALVRKIFKTDSVDKATYDKHKMGIPIHELVKS